MGTYPETGLPDGVYHRLGDMYQSVDTAWYMVPLKTRGVAPLTIVAGGHKYQAVQLYCLHTAHAMASCNHGWFLNHGNMTPANVDHEVRYCAERVIVVSGHVYIWSHGQLERLPDDPEAAVIVPPHVERPTAYAAIRCLERIARQRQCIT